jgi:predicted RNA-binding protein with PIN domain
MSDNWILVDGYSVLHAWPKLRKLAGRSLEQQRLALLRVLRQYADQRGVRLTVVFDGYRAKHKPEPVEATQVAEAIFSETGKTADDVIERLVAQADHRDGILVVSSDNMVRQTVESLGGRSVSSEIFEAEVEAALKDLAKAVREHSRQRRIGLFREHLER